MITDDDYALTLYRIPGKFSELRDPPRVTPKPGILMMHSMFWDMNQWVSNDADKAQAFNLVDGGFDVWMGNSRGVSYSSGHLNYTKHDQEYWQFNIESMGFHDLPAFMEFIFAKTGLEKIGYLGHS